MAYEVLARKWRPQRFSELVGQEHISTTLKNAIARNRIGHAYLFVGSRGVGKTTSARLFAKSLNCTDLQNGEPCCKCDSCISITNGSSLDVIEIDGASNNGVENVRGIIEKVQYLPVQGNYKIYIIDEVHMLSNNAWNALLKTLEEPPPHAKFIFATTEVNKVLPTVLSRCQRFDFKTIPANLIEKKLREIATAEKIFVDNMALAAIARVAEGGMRDAQSIFDQMIAFCGGNDESETITENKVVDVFGLVATEDIFELIGALFSNQVSDVILKLNKLSRDARDFERLYSDLLYYFRCLLVMQYCKEKSSEILLMNEVEHQKLQGIMHFPVKYTATILDYLVENEGTMRSSFNKRIAVEMTLIRAMKEVFSVDIDQVIEYFNKLKNNDFPNQILIEKPILITNSSHLSKENNFSEIAPIAETSLPEIGPIAEKSLPEITPIAETSLPEITPIAETSLPEIGPIAEKSLPEIAPIAEMSLPEIGPIAEKSLPEIGPIAEKSLLESTPEENPFNENEILEYSDVIAEGALLPISEFIPDNYNEMEDLMISEDSDLIELVKKELENESSELSEEQSFFLDKEMREKVGQNPFVNSVKDLFGGNIIDVK